MHVPQPKLIYEGIVAVPSPMFSVEDPDYRKQPFNFSDEVRLWIIDNDTTTFSIQIRESLDGVTWFDVGSPVTIVGLTAAISVKAPFMEVEVSGMTGSPDLDVWIF